MVLVIEDGYESMFSSCTKHKLTPEEPADSGGALRHMFQRDTISQCLKAAWICKLDIFCR